MSIESILIVLLYSLKPYTWLLILLVLLPILSFLLIKPKTRLLHRPLHLVISAIIGIIAGLAAPYIMMSKLSYVATTTDRVTLIAIMIGCGVYVWLLLKPLNRIRHP
jgi:hypothetical protein